jgi:MFS family permease
MILIALVFMVGAAGAEGGIQQTYFAPHLANDFGYSALVVGILITAMNIGGIGGPILFGWLSDRMSRIGVLQASLFLSALGTLWVAWMGPGEIALFFGLMLYSAVIHSRGTLTQAIVADLASDEDRDAAFSLYFFLGFLAQPMWLLVTGLLMDQQGWGIAVSRLAVSYLVGVGLLFFVRDVRGPAKVAAA